MSTDRPGTVIAGKYELRQIAGKGGMATVWRAVSRGAAGFERSVAVKRILPGLNGNTEFVQMFIEEARVGSHLQHPNIVQINDFGVDTSGGYFLVMEWVEGLDFGRYLHSYKRINKLAPWPLVLAVCIEALRGLSAAHERPEGAVIHRDVTPQNILVGRNGIAKLSDFGLARAMDRARMTRPDIVKGKLSYLAPELTHGASPSIQTDIFGAGIVLWEALTGLRLFDGESDVKTLLMVRSCEIPSLQRLRPDLPAALCDAVHKALAQDPKDRFETAYLMCRALARVLRTIPDETDARIIARTIHEARWRLAESGA